MKFIPRHTSTAKLRRMFRTCESALLHVKHLGSVRELYRAMRGIETELELRKRIPKLAPRRAK
jgi:hypothetical protein